MRLLHPLIAAGLTLAAPCAATAAVVSFDAAPGSREVSTVRELYKSFVARSPGVKLEVARVDIDGSGVPSLAVRFVSPATCDGDRCHTVVLRHDGRRWQEVLARKASTLSIGRPTNYPNAGGKVRDIKVDATETWVWNGSGKYSVTLDGLGAYIPAQGEVPPQVADAAAGGFDSLSKGSGKKLLARAQAILRGVPLDLGMESGPVWQVLALPASGFCSASGTCPSVFVVKSGQAGWRDAGAQMSDAADVILPSTHAGVHDIGMGDRNGYRTYAWNGATFALIATSYPSEVTPAP